VEGGVLLGLLITPEDGGDLFDQIFTLSTLSCLAYPSPLKMGAICSIRFFTVSTLHGTTMQKTSTLHSDCCESLKSIQVFYFLGNGYRKVVHLLGNGYALDSMAVCC
jgi:hypothetical protein